MALVLSGQFDFSKTYWLFNGIAGADPADASIGSAAWSRYVIDGDVAYELDSREADPSWPYAIVPIGATLPNPKPKSEGWEPDPMAYELNPSLVAWAYGLTRDVPIPDSRKWRPSGAAITPAFPTRQAAVRPPGRQFRHEPVLARQVLTRWANGSDEAVDGRRRRLCHGGHGGPGIRLRHDAAVQDGEGGLPAGPVSSGRRAMLRAPPKMDANTSMHADYAGYIPSLEAAYRVGSVVVHELAGNSDKYRDRLPTP